jgi:amidase
LVAAHAITRSVRDSAALLDATSGPDTGDPYWAPPVERPYQKEAGTDPGRLRIAFSEVPLSGAAIHNDCAKAVRETALLCEGLGHEVAEASPAVDGDHLYAVFTIVRMAGHAWIIDTLARATGQSPTADRFEPITWNLYEKGSQYSASAYLSAMTTLQRVSRDIARFFDTYDLWLTPTYAEPPLPLGSFQSATEDPLKGLSRMAAFTPFMRIANITGQPAMSMPLFWNKDGLPVGTHFTGRFGDEATLFRLAAQLEAARPWADRRPPVSE